VETGSIGTACATTQFPQSLITETLREKPALARPIRGLTFAYPVSGRRNMPNSGPGLWP